MAFTYSFGPGIALDPVSRTTAVSATGYATATADSTTPLTVQIGGVETTSIQSGTDGFVQRFVAEQGSVWLHFPGLTPYRLDSFDGVLETVQEQAQVALEAAQSAADVAARTMQLKGVARDGISFWGAFTEDAAPGPEDGVQVGDLGVLLP